MLLTPGPTEVAESVRTAMAQPIQNPDVEPEFFAFYRELQSKLARVYGTDDDVLVLGGEGILGLEAAVASTVEPGDEVLCLANGIYGEGFADFVANAGGEPVVASAGHREPLDVDRAAELLDSHDFVAATMVHCETPTGVLNDVEPVLDLLDDHGVLSIVDAVSSLGGTPVPTDDIDVCLGASQKCLSSPPGLTTVSVSDAAWDRVEAVDPDALYTNLLPWRDAADEEWFPYTHLVSNCYALDESLSLVLDEGLDAVFERHERAADRCRERGADLGLDPFPPADLAAPTVTAFAVEGSAADLQRRLADEHDVVLATGIGDRADDVLRVGHMGYGADVEKVDEAMDALGQVL